VAGASGRRNERGGRAGQGLARSGDVGHALAGLVVVSALFAIMGIGIGSVLRNQGLAISPGLVSCW
jgi:hypothetical protein